MEAILDLWHKNDKIVPDVTEFGTSRLVGLENMGVDTKIVLLC